MRGRIAARGSGRPDGWTAWALGSALTLAALSAAGVSRAQGRLEQAPPDWIAVRSCPCRADGVVIVGDLLRPRHAERDRGAVPWPHHGTSRGRARGRHVAGRETRCARLTSQWRLPP
jgi:hypothetical protein